MGTVYRARQPSMGRDVALKEIVLGPQGDPEPAARFLQEARVGGALAHPNVVVVYDYFEADGAAYIAMELVEHGPLTPLMQRLTLVQSVGVLEGLLSALSRASEAGIVHRDLKPANLLVTREGTIKVADFGIAKAFDATMQAGLTPTGLAVGTPAYMAPEQAEGGAIDPRTDLYATGAIAYEMLTGRPPFDRNLPWQALIYKHVHEEPPRPQQVNPNLPPAFCDWIGRMLAKRPHDRPPDAATAWAELEEIAVAQLDWRWRRAARLPVGWAATDQVALAPAPFAATESVPEYGSPTPRGGRGTAERAPARRPWKLIAGAAAVLVGVLVVVGVVVLGGGSDGDTDRATAVGKPTRRANAQSAARTRHRANVQRLLTMVPASMRDRCEDETVDPTGELSDPGDELAEVSCEVGGTTFYYKLYREAADAREWFSVGAESEEDEADGSAKSCRGARTRTPFVGTWSRPGESRSAGRLLCTYDEEIASLEWTERGRPILGSLLTDADDPRTALKEAERAFRRATR